MIPKKKKKSVTRTKNEDGYIIRAKPLVAKNAIESSNKNLKSHRARHRGNLST